MQNIVIYPGAILELQNVLMKLKSRKVFLVTGKKSFESCGAKQKLKWMLNSYDILHFYDFQINPNSKDVINGARLFKKSDCDVIISVGGGSVIDMAKLINYYHSISADKIDESNINNDNHEHVNHISLPTTAGSGAEATHFAVMYIGNTKYSISHPKLIPDYAIIDSELHNSQTSYQKAISGADALAQAMESFWSIHSTEESRVYSERALELVWNNLPKVVHNGDKLAHLNLAIGANMAGRAINIAKTTAPHALAYGLTKFAGLPHGHAVAIALPLFFKEHNRVNNLYCNDPRGIQHFNTVMSKINQLIEGKRNGNVLNDYFKKLNIEVNPAKLNINLDIIEIIVDNINMQRLENNPLIMNKSYIKNLFSKIF